MFINLHVIEACLKVMIAIFYFAIPKVLQILWKMVLILSLYILCLKKYKSQIFYKKNKSPPQQI